MSDPAKLPEPTSSITEAIRLLEEMRDYCREDAEAVAQFDRLILSLYVARTEFVNQATELRQLRAKVSGDGGGGGEN